MRFSSGKVPDPKRKLTSTRFNRDYSPDELRRLSGTLGQLAGIRLYELSDGKVRGLRAADAWAGGGLRFTIWLDGALDAGRAEFRGKHLAWRHPALGPPAQFEVEQNGWVRTFGFPAVSPESELTVVPPGDPVNPRDALAELGLANQARFQAPDPTSPASSFSFTRHPTLPGM